ncbi:hypothetical protein ABZ930_37720 [Streptomyces sp. NPDC046716]|uniref:hypothetical protein n=1 Tax=Streptomyces sp. NPDC046716 TaxID=3157093 RepID=UPI0033D95D14
MNTTQEVLRFAHRVAREGLEPVSAGRIESPLVETDGSFLSVESLSGPGNRPADWCVCIAAFADLRVGA